MLCHFRACRRRDHASACRDVDAADAVAACPHDVYRVVRRVHEQRALAHGRREPCQLIARFTCAQSAAVLTRVAAELPQLL